MKIYMITNKVNGRRYIGSTVQSLEDRMCKHRYKAKIGVARPLYEDMRLFDRDAFAVEVLAECDEARVMRVREADFIRELGTLVEHGGYNIAPDGTVGAGLKRAGRTRALLSTRRKAWHRAHPNSTHKSQPFREVLNTHRNEVEELRQHGTSYSAIALRYSCTPSAVYYAIKRWHV